MRLPLVATTLSVAVFASGCLVAAPPPAGSDADCDGLDDGIDAWVGACEPVSSRVPRPLRVAIAVVRAPGAPVEGLLEAETLLDALVSAFEAASGGRADAMAVTPALALELPAGARSAMGAPVSLARAAGAVDAELLVLLTDAVPATDGCNCIAWAVPTHGRTSAWGAHESLRAVIGLGALADVAHEDELSYRFLHEAAHVSCCDALAPDHPFAAAALDGRHFAHREAGDPAADDGTLPRAKHPRYHDASLVAMGFLDPLEARPLEARHGLFLSGPDVARALRPDA